MKDLTNEQISSIWHAQASTGSRSFADIVRAAIKADRELNGRTGESAERGYVVVTKNSSGQIVAVTRQDDEGRILSVISESEEQPAREWVGLTVTDIDSELQDHAAGSEEMHDFARTIESKLREKNT